MINFQPLLFSGFTSSGSGGGGSASYKSSVANAAALPSVGNSDGDVRVALDTDHIWVWNAATSRWIDVGLTATAVGSSPNADGYSLTLDNTTPNLSYQDLVLQPADATHPGVVTSGTQTLGGNKTLSGTVTLSSLSVSTPLQLDASHNIIASAIGLNTSNVSGVLPVSSGGTNSNTALNNNRVIISLGGALVEESAITGNRALASNSSGLPVASTTTDTELGYVSGVTSAIQTQLNNKIDTSAEGAPNGVATLDGSGKIPSAQLPSTVLQYEGLWNPSTNTPTLQDSTGTNGFVYQVSVVFAGPIAGLNSPTMVNFQVGNLVIFSSSAGEWQQTTAAAGVSSVNGAQGAVTVNAINQLTGDVTAGPASGSQSEVATITAGAVGPTKLGSVTDGVTLDQSGAGSTLEVKTGGISNTQVNASANIARTKLASGTAFAWETNNSSGVLQDTLVTANRAVATDSSGLPVASTTTDAELGFVHGVTSAIQTQLNGKASTTLNNLGTTAINTDLLPDTTDTRALGSASERWNRVSARFIGNGTIDILNTVTDTLNDLSSNESIDINNRQLTTGGTVKLDWSGTDVSLNGRKLTNVNDPSSAQDAATKNYVDTHTVASVTGDISQTSFTIANNQTSPANVTGLAFANGSVESAQVQYSIVITATTSLYESGTINLIQKGGTWSIAQSANFDNTNVIFSVTNAGQVQYTSPSYTGYTTGKMQFRALVTSV